MNKQLEVRRVSVAYGRNLAVNDASFTLSVGQIGCLLGPSGCGKTTLLRAIAGFEPLAQGEIHLHGQRVSAPGSMLPPEKRRVGMVFQDFALFPHLDIASNIAFGLRTLTPAAKRQRVQELLHLIGLERIGGSYPHQLSGGQQQRVALARAMAPRPDILLLDEPFSSLDVELREQLAREVRSLLKRDRITAILVTHDQLEAFAMSDLVGVMRHGGLQQWDTPFEVYHNPVDRFVADFVGQGSLLNAEVLDGNRLRSPLGDIEGEVPSAFQSGAQVQILLRPDDVVLEPASPRRAKVVDKVFRGSEYLYTLQLDGGERILSLTPSHHDLELGAQTGIRLDTRHMVLFPRSAD